VPLFEPRDEIAQDAGDFRLLRLGDDGGLEHLLSSVTAGTLQGVTVIKRIKPDKSRPRIVLIGGERGCGGREADFSTAPHDDTVSRFDPNDDSFAWFARNRMLLRAEGYYGVDAGGAASWKKAGNEAAERQ
jgi:hypothetical protein